MNSPTLKRKDPNSNFETRPTRKTAKLIRYDVEVVKCKEEYSKNHSNIINKKTNNNNKNYFPSSQKHRYPYYQTLLNEIKDLGTNISKLFLDFKPYVVKETNSNGNGNRNKNGNGTKKKNQYKNINNNYNKKLKEIKNSFENNITIKYKELEELETLLTNENNTNVKCDKIVFVKKKLKKIETILTDKLNKLKSIEKQYINNKQTINRKKQKNNKRTIRLENRNLIREQILNNLENLTQIGNFTDEDAFDDEWLGAEFGVINETNT